MIAGPNGAGKTTLTLRLRTAGFEFGEYINPDDIAGELTGSYESRVAMAQLIADRRRDSCIAERRSFSFETVMSHPSKLDVLVRAKAAGFFVQLFFVGTDDPETNIERVALRVTKGGHDVPAGRIVARWKRTMGFLHQAISTSDRAFIFDNSATRHGGPRLVLEIQPSEGCDWNIVRRSTPPAWVRHYVLAHARDKFDGGFAEAPGGQF
jgi:predicted ABC-type ATPase